MAVHNGELFLRDQFNSILPYLNLGDEVVISDDGSTDGTLKIIESIQDPRINLLTGKSFGHPVRNFEHALSHCKNEIIFLADQDDIWYPEKIKRMTLALENSDLVICDCRLVDEQLNVLAPSFFEWNGSKKGLIKNLFKNSFVGCCMAFHRKILERVLPFPKKIPTHDQWIGLIAQKYFRVNFIPTILVDYRRHRNTFTSTGSASRSSLAEKVKSRFELVRLLLTRYMDKIRASIVTYKTDPLLLKAAMNSFTGSSLAGLLTIIDNSPTDSLRSLCELPGVEYFFSGRNVGYGRGHNLAMKESFDKAQYHLVLNPDVSFEPVVLEQLYNFMEMRQEAGLVMPRVIGPDRTLQMFCKLLPTPFDLASRRFFPIKSLLEKFNDRYEMKDTGYEEVMNVPFLSGCFMFLRCESLKSVGLFDERFFLYAEDTDLSRRMHLQYQTLYYPHACITHVHARGSYKDFSLTLQNIKSAVQYFNKWGWWFDEQRKTINERALSSGNLAMVQKQSLREVSAA